ncbi:Dam family site-specific DNA-(adenine-N6)-methyltransferase (plasmid) [Aneurinibacillus sp. Ricciae_BoGa-3]|uniref:DNA adenine methylase n=1 Tax=Aneurinibacillus sp. Ricciae_BoGa-3 TaxID=3022697 RepID=UPI002342260E|nr:Dam family site-specific DNA-(adenine-N6)-methyltransferase [Aneurinibacillus sp. Ricciae_BoGa-3]WCK56939.1 Dam family site-specific DNA-(adenine-N6)-methyltransferase [Aneurinibacillus sp. Ricciae_BoGa-3]WCK57762.1 Dam family site-specific DNA-(adenine-N6)-methyltransferase [Aneurinibacillus sp. Ricciae_BoGa-3]
MSYNSVKWSGSKKSQAKEIIRHFPSEINTYYEPFLGSASVLFELLHSDKQVKRYVASDKCKPLIDIYRSIQQTPEALIDSYRTKWESLQSIGQDYYYQVRKEFNQEHQPDDFLFLTRTCINGLIRFNQKGEFNSSFHFTRKGIHPDTLASIILDWSKKIEQVEFIHQEYQEFNLQSGDFVYADPPYFGTKGMYFETIDYEQFWSWLEALPCSFALSFDGIQGNEDKTHQVPNSLYTQHLYLYSGVSSFRRLKNQGAVGVQESLYLNIK